MNRLYVAGPMSGYPDFNFPAFNEVAEYLREMGYEIENPADTGIVEGWEWKDYLRSALKQMLGCEGVCVLPGHEMSKGARLETEVAFRLGMPIMPIEFWVVNSPLYRTVMGE